MAPPDLFSDVPLQELCDALNRGFIHEREQTLLAFRYIENLWHELQAERVHTCLLTPVLNADFEERLQWLEREYHLPSSIGGALRCQVWGGIRNGERVYLENSASFPSHAVNLDELDRAWGCITRLARAPARVGVCISGYEMECFIRHCIRGMSVGLNPAYARRLLAHIKVGGPPRSVMRTAFMSDIPAYAQMCNDLRGDTAAAEFALYSSMAAIESLGKLFPEWSDPSLVVRRRVPEEQEEDPLDVAELFSSLADVVSTEHLEEETPAEAAAHRLAAAQAMEREVGLRREAEEKAARERGRLEDLRRRHDEREAVAAAERRVEELKKRLQVAESRARAAEEEAKRIAQREANAAYKAPLKSHKKARAKHTRTPRAEEELVAAVHDVHVTPAQKGFRSRDFDARQESASLEAELRRATEDLVRRKELVARRDSALAARTAAPPPPRTLGDFLPQA